ncbi:glycerophosphodiester phosphodiesterase family protein [Novosphingobium sp. TH158]|uniref:glycerophosphodiester phosphodiesterase family protein n=1 Tax=Novosphingobium sp. TH158 TaxID=2067455 RepID=UPI000C7DD721|nr:glycerophosphodiester phosphodiesterase family protein [Novosphingobium sp. TH158]PLK27397.1 glycerophosphodiester phosphodiesterase [Novosphingobium sp. TH158]
MPLSLLAPLDRWLAPAPDGGRASWLPGARFAHRGLHGDGLPENSPAAFAAAIERGWGIECDVQKSSDDQAMVFHDFELDRLTGESGPVNARSAAQLGTIRLSGGTDTIPHLRQVLDLVGGRVPILIEVKSRRERPVPAICLAVRRALEGYQGPHAVMSFDPRVCAWFARHSPLTTRGLVLTEENDKALPGRLRRHLWLWIAKPDFLAYDVRDLPSRFAASQRRRGLPVATWTVRNADLRERAAAHADAPIAEGAGVA